MALDDLVKKDFEIAMDRVLEGRTDSLRRFYADNVAIFQKPPRYLIHQWDIPFNANPPQQVANLEAVRDQLESGALDLQRAIDACGGTVTKLGWHTVNDLPANMPPKAKNLIVQTRVGYSIPYQQKDGLHIIWIEAWEPSQTIAFEEAIEQVKEAYVVRHGQQIYREWADNRLSQTMFQFSEDNLMTALSSLNR